MDIPGGTKADAAYDLALYSELGNRTRGVLVVTIILNFIFKDGVSQKPAQKGAKLGWTPNQKTDFMKGVKQACSDLWGERHRITTSSKYPEAKDVGVIFDIKTNEDMSVFKHSHWNLTTTKIDEAWATSSTRGVVAGFQQRGSQTEQRGLDARGLWGPVEAAWRGPRIWPHARSPRRIPRGPTS